MSAPDYASCIAVCNSCAIACDVCAVRCLDEHQPRPMAACIRLDMDCAALCRLAVGAMARHSRFAPELCGLCARFCRACAEECRKHPVPHCQKCAEACAACATECEAMSRPASH